MKIVPYAFIVVLMLGSIATCQHNQKSMKSPPAQPSAPTLEAMIQQVQTSVVAILVTIEDAGIQDEETRKFVRDNSIFVVGTGFIVNDRGQIITAEHVVDDLKNLKGQLEAKHANVSWRIGIPLPAAETKHVTVLGGITGVPFTVTLEDPVNDLAVLTPGPNIFALNPLIVSPGIPVSHPSVARLSTQRPRDGQEVFAIGFPAGSKAVITTSGHVASSAGSANLLTAQRHGYELLSQVYVLDLRIKSREQWWADFSQQRPERCWANR
jgi:S1-C subfamily serine protease